MSHPRAESAIAAVGYIRVSTEDQARGEKTSLADQRAAIQLLSTRLGLHIGQIFEDAGVSGGSADRPAFAALLEYCKTHPRPRSAPGHVLVLNDSRWGRFQDPEEATYWRVECKRHGWLVRFAEGDETQDPLARVLLRGIHSAQASAYREAIRANAKRGARGSAAQGFWLNEAPFGYRRMTVGGGRPSVVLEPGQRKSDDQKVKLTPGPAEEVATVRWMFATYAAGGSSFGALLRELRIRYPARKWSRTAIGKLLSNRTYLGDVIWCRRPHDKLEQQEHRVRPEAEWVIAERAHPALVDVDLFTAVRDRMHTNKRQTRATAGGYPLSGLIHCAQCGAAYIGAGGPKGPDGDPDRYRFYRDSGSPAGGGHCAGFTGTLQKRWIEPMVITTIADIVRQPAVRKLIAAAIDRALESGIRDSGARRRELEVARDRARSSQQRLVTALGAGVLQDGEAKPQLEACRAEITRTTAELERLSFQGRRDSRLETERDRLIALATDFAAQAQRLSGNALRELLQPWIANATVDKEKRVLVLQIRRVPGVFNLLDLTPQPDPSGQSAKVRLVETRVIPLPRTAWVARRRKAAGA